MGTTKQVKYAVRQPRRRQAAGAEGQKPVVLIGFMGCGKSLLGRLLARKLGLRFVDLDVAIVEFAGRSIPEIFQRKGEAGFRALESRVLKKELRAGTVLGAGGGLVTQASNLRLLKNASARVVWIDPSWGELWARLRVSRRQARPMLIDPNTGKPKSQAAIRGLWKKRRAFYEKAAEARLRVVRLEPSARTVERLARLLERN